MSQKRADYETDCGECMIYIAVDDLIWLGQNAQKLCRKCADKQDRVCPRCEGSKLPSSDVCAKCSNKRRSGFTSAFGRGGIW